MDIQSCLIKLGYKAVVWNNSYEGIKPHELETRPIPSLADLEAVWPQIEAERIAAEQAEAARIEAKAQALIDNLPTWQAVSDAIDAATTIAACKVILKKLARVVYWLAKDKAD
jgi:hypothetical protein